jgi:toxin ParE1/3/4
MAHRLTQRARTDLDDIWRSLAIESGSEAIADRQIDQLTDRFYLLANWPLLGRSRRNLRRRLRSHP